jgi:hypothetical protein
MRAGYRSEGSIDGGKGGTRKQGQGERKKDNGEAYELCQLQIARIDNLQKIPVRLHTFTPRWVNQQRVSG